MKLMNSGQGMCGELLWCYEVLIDGSTLFSLTCSLHQQTRNHWLTSPGSSKSTLIWQFRLKLILLEAHLCAAGSSCRRRFGADSSRTEQNPGGAAGSLDPRREREAPPHTRCYLHTCTRARTTERKAFRQPPSFLQFSHVWTSLKLNISFLFSTETK